MTTCSTNYLCQIYNGPITRRIAHVTGISLAGCPYRGTTTCYRCPWQPEAECGYNCVACEHRTTCKCAHDQAARLELWGLP